MKVKTTDMSTIFADIKFSMKEEMINNLISLIEDHPLYLDQDFKKLKYFLMNCSFDRIEEIYKYGKYVGWRKIGTILKNNIFQ